MNGLWSDWTEWTCLDSSDTDYDTAKPGSQRVRYKICTNPSQYDGGAYCGDAVDIKEILSCDAASPLCNNGVCGCSKNKDGEPKIKGDGTTQGSCATEAFRCHYDGECRGNWV